MGDKSVSYMETYTKMVLQLGEARAKGFLSESKFEQARQHLMELTSDIVYERPSKLLAKHYVALTVSVLVALSLWMGNASWSSSVQESANTVMIHNLERASSLHSEKKLTDDEFASTKRALIPPSILPDEKNQPDKSQLPSSNK